MTSDVHAERRSGFRPGWALTLATLVAFAVLLALGTWQVQRMYWKAELIAMREAGLAADPIEVPSRIDDPAALEFRRATAEGVFDHDAAFGYGAANVGGRLGHQLLTPLEREDGSVLLVDRGWVPEDWHAPAEALPAGRVRVTGILRDRSGGAAGHFTPDNRPERGRFFWYDMEAIANATGHELLPVVLEAEAEPWPGGHPLGGRTRIDLPDDHLGYAITWYGLAAGLVVIYLVFGFRRSKETR